MQGRLPVAGESDDVNRRMAEVESGKLGLQGLVYLFARGKVRVLYGGVPAALAVHAVEGAELVLKRHYFHAEAVAETAAVDGAIYDVRF